MTLWLIETKVVNILLLCNLFPDSVRYHIYTISLLAGLSLRRSDVKVSFEHEL